MTFPPGASSSVSGLGACLLAILLATATPVFAQGDFPVSSTGDIWFQVDHAGFLGEDEKIVEEYYFRVTNNQLTFEEKDGVLVGRVFVRLEFKDFDGKGLGEAGKRFEFSVDSLMVAESPDYAQLLIVREELDPRAHSVDITVEDLNARKRGILYMFTGKKKSGEAKGLIPKPPFVGQEFGISDLQFAWEVRGIEEGGDFIKHGLNVIPNPSRTYGLLQSRMTAYYEVYDLRELGEEPRDYVVFHEIEDATGNVIRGKPDSVSSASGEWIKVISFDLAHLRTGDHVFRAKIQHLETGAEAMTERSLSLLWKSEFWEMTEQEILDEARVLFTEDEYNRFKKMSVGDRAQFIEDFWSDWDPSPASASNELRQEFLRRVGFANRQFTTHIKGMLSDRGRMYIRFGEPDEVVSELMPTQGTQLDQEVRTLAIDDPRARMLATNDVIDTRPYIIWIYTRQGTPLFPERELTTSVTGLKFVFIDEMGTGHYVIRYQSDFIGY